jgi:hypothetical protein
LPNQCDLVVVIVHSRLGTALPTEYAKQGRILTGTEWEFEDALEGSNQNGTPAILVYQKTAPVLFDLSNGDPSSAKHQFDLVTSFFERLRSEAKSVRPFQETSEFTKMFANHLKGFVEQALKAPVPREVVIPWLSGSVERRPPMVAILGFIEDPLEDPHLRIMAVDRLADDLSQTFLTEDPAVQDRLASVARLLMAIPDQDLGKAGLKLTKRLIELGAMKIEDFRIGASSKKWEVKGSTVAVVSNYDVPEVIDVYEGIGKNLSYWRPVQTITEHLVRLMLLLNAENRIRAVAILEKLLSNPRQSEKQQGLLKAAILTLSTDPSPQTPTNDDH